MTGDRASPAVRAFIAASHLVFIFGIYDAFLHQLVWRRRARKPIVAGKLSQSPELFAKTTLFNPRRIPKVLKPYYPPPPLKWSHTLADLISLRGVVAHAGGNPALLSDDGRKLYKETFGGTIHAGDVLLTRIPHSVQGTRRTVVPPLGTTRIDLAERCLLVLAEFYDNKLLR